MFYSDEEVVYASMEVMRYTTLSQAIGHADSLKIACDYLNTFAELIHEVVNGYVLCRLKHRYVILIHGISTHTFSDSSLINNQRIECD